MRSSSLSDNLKIAMRSMDGLRIQEKITNPKKKKRANSNSTLMRSTMRQRVKKREKNVDRKRVKKRKRERKRAKKKSKRNGTSRTFLETQIPNPFTS